MNLYEHTIVAKQELSSVDFEKIEKNKKLISHRKVREGLAPLPGAKKGKVVMRIAPSASGPLHLPHAINLSLNYSAKLSNRKIDIKSLHQVKYMIK